MIKAAAIIPIFICAMISIVATALGTVCGAIEKRIDAIALEICYRSKWMERRK